VKIALDANVYIAAFATRGLCHAVMEYCLESHKLVSCEELFKEVCAKLRKKIKLPRGTTEEIDTFLRAHSELVIPAAVDPSACRDQRPGPRSLRWREGSRGDERKEVAVLALPAEAPGKMRTR